MSNSGSQAGSNGIPNAPPLPAALPLQRARDAATKLFGFSISQQQKSQNVLNEIGSDRFPRGIRSRFASLGLGNETTSHRTGLEINTLAINEKGTHVLLGGKEIFRTVKVEDGMCAEELNLRSAIRSNPRQASGQIRQNYSIDIADVAWASGDWSHFVAAATSSGKIILYDLGHAGLQAAQLHDHYRQVHKVTFHPHRGDLLLSGGQDGTVRLWDVRDVRQASTLQSKRKYSGLSDGVRDVKWSPTEHVDFAFGTDSGWIQSWDMRNLKTAKRKISAHSTTCNKIDWHPDGKHLLSAGSDKAVRVWDLSTAKRQIGSWEIRTPYPVFNARWRPGCTSSLRTTSDARQCTQIVTTYDQKHSALHIWDLRRPKLPFRETAPYPTAPTDLLWHSQDLLWTVGREGVFLQSDIQQTPKVMDRRNLQPSAISALGQIVFFIPSHEDDEPTDVGDATLSSLSFHDDGSEREVTGRGLTDDSPNRSFLGSSLTDKTTSSGRSRAPSITGGTRPNSRRSTVNLDDVMRHRQITKVYQIGFCGLLPFVQDPQIFRFLARKYYFDLSTTSENLSMASRLDYVLARNAECARRVAQPQLAHTWEVVRRVIIDHLEEKAKSYGKTKPRRKSMKHSTVDRLGAIARRMLHDELVASESFVKPFDRLKETGQVSTLSIAKPNLTATNLSAVSAAGDVADAVKRWSIHPKEKLNLEQRCLEDLSSIPRLEKHDSNESFNFLDALSDSRGASFPSSFGSPNSTKQLEMVSERPSRMNKHVRHRSLKKIDSRDFGIGSGASPAMPIPGRSGQPSGQGRSRDHAPAEDLHKTKTRTELALGSHSSAGRHGVLQDAHAQALRTEDGIHRQLPRSDADPKPLAQTYDSGEIFRTSFEPFEDDDEEDEDLEANKPFTLAEMLRELVQYYASTPDVQTAASLVLLLAKVVPRADRLSEAEAKVTVSMYIDALTAAGFAPDEIPDILDQHHDRVVGIGMHPVQVESILSTYHERLIAFRLFNEAAELRRLAFPAYPAVYEDALEDNRVNLHCSTCGDAISQDANKRQCKSCASTRESCPICWCVSSPFERDEDGQTARSAPGLYMACLICGHSGHPACLTHWFEVSAANGGGCPTPGCLCDCGSGKRGAEKTRPPAAQRRRRQSSPVKGDENLAVESKAVERTRTMLVNRRGGRSTTGAASA